MAVRSIAWKTFPLWMLALGGLGALGVLLASQVRLKEAGAPSAPTVVDGDVIVTGFRLSALSDGEAEWEVSAARARLFESKHQAVLDRVSGSVRMQDGAMAQFEGATAVLDTASRDFDLDGGEGEALLTLPNGYVIRTKRLRWLQSRGELTSVDAVSVVGSRVSFQGVGLLARPASQEFTILSDVRADVVS
ncbi:MAG: LPS export ABC transporter periplasmic protein LptC [Nitrospirota bacterium]